LDTLRSNITGRAHRPSEPEGRRVNFRLAMLASGPDESVTS